eukprot:314753_1
MSTKFQSLFGNIFTVVSFLIIILWSIIGVKYMFLKYFNPSKYHQLKNIEPPSPYLLNYIHLFDVLTWIFNIYIVVISYEIYYHAHEVCSMEEKPLNWKEICLKTSLCDINNNECVSNAVIDYIWIFVLVSICINVLASMLHPCIQVNQDQISDFLINGSHFICLRYFKKTKWSHHYLKRNFFPISSAHCKLLFLYNVWGRYLMLFISSLLTLYIGYNDGDFGVEWYNIFPILFIWILNEIIKNKYRKLPPYDRNDHIQYVINSVYGKSLGGVIWSFIKECDFDELERVCLINRYDNLF